jgi:putative DNA-invertase from lambdoid prophage Rac
MRAALYARVSTHDQQTLGLQTEAMASYLSDRGWHVVKRVEDIGSGAKDRPGRESLLRAARRARSMSSWSGAWTAGGGRCPTWW